MKSIQNVSSSGSPRLGLPEGRAVQLGKAADALPRLVKTATGQLQVAGQPFRFAGSSIYWLGLNDNARDAQGNATFVSDADIRLALDQAVSMGATVIRVHTLGISLGKPNTMMPTLGVWNDAAVERADFVAAEVRKRPLRLWIPTTDRWDFYHGGGVTLAKMVLGGAATISDFFTNATVRTAHKAYLTTLLNRVNRYTGVRWGDDPAITWETGNEVYDAPVAWHVDITAHLKSLAPLALVADGSAASGMHVKATAGSNGADMPGLADPNTDILGGHFYDDHRMDLAWVATDAAAARAAGKAYVVGEYDWTDTDNNVARTRTSTTRAQWHAALEADPNVSGSLFWSLEVNKAGVGTHRDGYELYADAPENSEQAAGRAALTAHAANMKASATAGASDLVVTGLSSSPTSPTAGDAVTFSGVVKNQGTAATPAGTVVGLAFSIDGTLVSWSDTSATALAAGASRTLTANGGPNGTATWAATGGTHSLTAVVDDVNRITESDETNNASATTTVTVTGSGGGTATVQPGTGVMTTSSSPVRRAREKTDSIGVATHLTYPAYADLAQVVAKLQYVNINHLRDGWGTGRGSIVTYLLNNYPSARLCMVLDANDWSGNASTQTGGVSAAAQVAEFQNTGLMPLVEYVEGPNERDSIATAAANYFAPRAAAFKAAGVKVGTPSMAQVNPKSPYDAMASVLQDQVDVVTHHPYPGSDSMMNSTILNTLTTNSRSFFSTAKLASTDPIPMIFTETGFATSANGDQGKSMPPTGPFAHQHLRIWSKSFLGLPGKMYAARVYKYELIDQGATDVETTFGLFDSSGNPKPVATAIRNSQMLEMDNDPAALTFTPVDVPGITITGTNSGTDVLKLQKANGEWWYEIWQNDVTFATTGARTEVHPSGVNVTLSWTGSRSVSVYRPTSSQAATQTATGSSITVTSSYDPIYLRIV